jgi:hypothetical protein
MGNTSPTPKLEAMVQADPDLVDRIFEYLIDLHPQLAALQLEEAKQAVRDEVGGQEWYVRRRDGNLGKRILALFNGRNAAEVARQLRIGRKTVYRYIKQPGGIARELSISPGNDTGDTVASAHQRQKTATPKD